MPLCKLAIRPGIQEPLFFLAIERGKFSLLPSKHVQLFFAEEILVVGVSSHVITDRSPATSPSDQLKEAVPVVTASRPRDIAFTHSVSLSEWREDDRGMMVWWAGESRMGGLEEGMRTVERMEGAGGWVGGIRTV